MQSLILEDFKPSYKRKHTCEKLNDMNEQSKRN